MITVKSLPIEKKHLLAPLSIFIIASVCFLLDQSLSPFFIYSREAIVGHEYWRLFTGHLFHTNYAHFLLNSLAIILLWALHGQFYSIKNYIALFIFSAILISSAIFFTDPNMSTYVGLSGVLHAFFVWGALKDIQHKDKTGYVLLLGALVKVGHEQFFGASEDLAALINANVAIDAHLWGGISGVVVFSFSVLFSNKRSLH